MASVRVAVESYKPQRVDVTDKIAKIQENRAKAAQHAAEYIAQLEVELKEREARLETVKAAKPPEEMTVPCNTATFRWTTCTKCIQN